ncbi:ATP synthase subunit I [Salinisphaera sp. Q1T1-3]|uniref:ATP synthase subunit I n=1 Tax=Salinisphaera sp. Q1T1-3 TaxID=2321229 RepID=UPI000E70F825|nr:ATP synthase subunit I [Salinisphaera sp. Q1T1-3]RJS93328.1 ATP synthase subunit I [Salinisphaera sp. Q1T1-3]
MRNVVTRLLIMQSTAAVCVAILVSVIYGSEAAVAAIYGGVVALIMTSMLAWRISQVSRSGAALRWLVIGAGERMIMVCVAFAVGIGFLNLVPIPMLIGFGVAELAYYLAAGPMRRYMLELMGRRYDGQ